MDDLDACPGNHIPLRFGSLKLRVGHLFVECADDSDDHTLPL
jgi:hypothetical protein